MQIQKVQYNNNSNVDFCANSKITGNIDDISLKQLKTWGNKIQLIGSPNGVVELEFGKPVNIDVNKLFPKPSNPRFIGNWRCHVWRLFGVYPPNSDNLFISKRNIIASETFTGSNSENIGYMCAYHTNIENADVLKKWHIKSTTACVNDYLSKLKKEIIRQDR